MQYADQLAISAVTVFQPKLVSNYLINLRVCLIFVHLVERNLVNYIILFRMLVLAFLLYTSRICLDNMYLDIIGFDLCVYIQY